MKTEMKLKIVNSFLQPQAYTAVNTEKKRICLHHTVGGPLAMSGVTATFNSQKNIATTYVVNGDGVIYKLIPENYWAHHLGLRVANNQQLNRETIGIEINAWGRLKKEGNQFINAYGRPIATNIPVEELDKPFRDSLYYQEYYQEQIDALYLLLKMLSVEHKIPLEGLNRHLNFELLSQIDMNKSGIFSHTNFRQDKSDVYPAKKLISMLKML